MVKNIEPTREGGLMYLKKTDKCTHNAQVFLENGPHCNDCGAKLVWVTAEMLKDVEKKLLDMTAKVCNN